MSGCRDRPCRTPRSDRRARRRRPGSRFHRRRRRADSRRKTYKRILCSHGTACGRDFHVRRAGAPAITVDDGRAASRIRARMPGMSVAMRKIATLVLDDPAALLELSITDVASRAGTSAATVTRFCRQLGYSGYVQFRVGLASDLGHDDAYESWRADIGREFDPQDPPSRLLRTLRSAQERALDQTAELIDLNEVARIAKAIWTCDHLDIYGVVGSAEMASELQGRLYRIGVNAHAWGEVHHGLASAAILPARSESR